MKLGHRIALWFVMVAYVIGKLLEDLASALDEAIRHLEGEQ